MHIDLRNYIIDNIPMELEFKQGSFVKVTGRRRSTYMYIPIAQLDGTVDLFQEIKDTY